jgi:hypothetical protein
MQKTHSNDESLNQFIHYASNLDLNRPTRPATRHRHDAKTAIPSLPCLALARASACLEFLANALHCEPTEKTWRGAIGGAPPH